MKRFLQQHMNREGSHDGWALKFRSGGAPLRHTVCTNRDEARQVKKEMEEEDRGQMQLFGDGYKLCRVRIQITEV